MRKESNIGQGQEAESSIVSKQSEMDEVPSNESLKKELSTFMERESRSQSERYYETYPGTESIHYDFTAERQNVNATDLIQSTAHLIKGCIGAGILGMHEAFMYGGLWTSLGVCVVMGLIVWYCMMMLVNSAQKMYVRLRVPRLSYPDLAEAALATGPVVCLRKYKKWFRYTVDICLFLEMLGTCCVYQLMVATALKQGIGGIWQNPNTWSIRIYILMVTAPLLALCLIRRMKCLAYLSAVADVAVLICVSITIYYSVIQIVKVGVLTRGWNDVYGMLRFGGLCIYSIQGATVLLPIENHMRSPKHIRMVLDFGMTIAVFLVMTVGSLGYSAWGKECLTPITTHMPRTESVPIVLQFLLVVVLSVTFSVHFWVPFRALWRYLSRLHRRFRGFWEQVYRTIHVVLITASALAFPQASNIMLFMGSFFMAFTGFIFPAFIESLVTWREHKPGKVRWRLFKNITIITLALCFCVTALTASFVR